MTEFLEEFRSAVNGYLKDNGILVDKNDIGDDIIVEAYGKVVQLRLLENGKLMISTIVYFNMSDDEYVDNRNIAEFNAYHLFRGGYRLMVEPTTSSVYVEEGATIRGQNAESLSARLADFVSRSISCTRWYIEKLRSSRDKPAVGGKIFA